MMPSRRFIACLLAVMVLMVLVGEASACPTCKAALASHDGNQGDMVGAFMWSILFMMGMPFILLGSLGGLFYWQVRRARAMQPLPTQPMPVTA